MSNTTSDKKVENYMNYGVLIHAWRSEIKHTIAKVSHDTGISTSRLKALEQGLEKPDWKELELFAKQFCVSLRDLLPIENDLDRGMKFFRKKNVEPIEQKRDGRLQYTYYARVMTPALPNIKPIELLLHLNKAEDVVINHGHFFHQYTEVLHGGPVAYLWKWKDKVHEAVFEEGDSWLIPGFTPHGFYSPDPKHLGRILALTFGQHLAGDAKQELSIIGKDNASRIISDDREYYPQGEDK
jgi:hypothetical protein